jgi:NDP-sugar pyrophosphorylase family protein
MREVAETIRIMKTIPAPKGRQTIVRGVSPWNAACTAAILAGGLGTRLRPAVDGIPKVLARVSGRPFVIHLLEQMAQADIAHAVLLTGYKADEVRNTLGDKYDGVKLSYSVEATPLGTAGALRQALPEMTTESVLLLNGDSYCDVALARLLAAHRRRRADLTMTLAYVADTERFGRVRYAASDRMTGFLEKQKDAGPGWINAGVYVLTRSLVAEIPADREVSLEREMLPLWTKERRCFAFRQTKRFLDIGTPADFARAPAFLQRKDT